MHAEMLMGKICDACFNILKPKKERKEINETDWPNVNNY